MLARVFSSLIFHQFSNFSSSDLNMTSHEILWSRLELQKLEQFSDLFDSFRNSAKQDKFFFPVIRSMTDMNFLFNLIWIERMVDTFHLMQIKVCEIYMPFIGESCFVFVKCECASINTFICIWLFERCFVMYVLLCENKNLSTHIHDPHFKSWSKTC